ncbi:MAG: hypothetical protein WCI12_02885 [Actinomycetes bacterium]
MTNSPNRLFKIIAGLVVVVVVTGFSFLVVNLVTHAIHRAGATPVTTKVVGVRATGPSSVLISAEVTSRSASTATVACLVGVERPSTPLAFPIRREITLKAGETQSIVLTRQLIRPEATAVTLADVAIACT